MPNLRDIQRRIASVKNTEQITRAMYMVSAAKLRRAQESAEAARPYAQTLEAVMQNLVSRVEERDHPLIAEREVKKAEILLFTSDRGLCGGFNTNLVRTAERFLRKSAKEEKFEQVSVTTVGKKGRDYFKKRQVDIRAEYTDIARNVNVKMADEIAEDTIQNYLEGNVDAVYIVYPVFRSAMVQTPTLMPILPFEPREIAEGDFMTDYIYEPDAASLLGTLLPKHIKIQIYRAMLETVASEHAARMTAMDSASSNAVDMIDRLTLQFNRARQAAITTELMEIISGAEALEK